MTTNTELIDHHLRAAVLGEPMPSFRGAGMDALMQALQGINDPTLPAATRYRDLSRIGLVAMALLLERATTSMQTERELEHLTVRRLS